MQKQGRKKAFIVSDFTFPNILQEDIWIKESDLSSQI